MTKYALGDFIMAKSTLGDQVFQVTSIVQTLEPGGKHSIHYKSENQSFEESAIVGRVTLEGHRKRQPRKKKVIQNTPTPEPAKADEPEFPFVAPAETKTA